MTLKRRTGGAWVDITTTLKRRTAGAWANLDIIRRRASGAWTVVWKRITITSAYSYVTKSSGIATATYELRFDGTVWAGIGSGTLSQTGTWLLSGTASAYETRVTATSGTFTSGTVGTWLSLASNRSWTVQQGTSGANTVVFDVEIRNSSTGVVVDTVVGGSITAEII